ncbi:MAG TPA: oligosaccharide flippase family protein [Dehalococcoidia bacterium]|nr:oligosaccharide flippase family protein [Dehalococcoidia bacterium]
MSEESATTGTGSLSLASGSLLLVTGRVLEYMAVGVAGVLIARGLGPDGRGVYSLVSQSALWAVAFLVPGLAEAAIYLAGRGYYRLAELWGNYLSWCLGVTALLMATALAASLVGMPLLGMEPWQLVLALCGGSAILLYQGAQTLLLGRGWAGRYVLAQVSGPLVRLAGVGVAAFVGMTVPSVLGIWVGATLAATVLALALARLPLRPTLDLGSMRSQLAFGGKGFAGWVLAALNHRVDVFIVGGVLGPAAVGQYTVAFNSAELSWWIPLAVGSVLYPKASALSVEASVRLGAEACRRTLLVAALSVAVLGFSGHHLIPVLYGEEFRGSVTAFYILLPSGLLYSITKVLSSSLWGLGRPEVGIYAGAASLPSMLALNAVLVPRMGIEGAAVASLVAYSLNALVVLGTFVRCTATPWWQAVTPRADDLRVLVQGGLSVLVRARGWAGTGSLGSGAR